MSFLHKLADKDKHLANELLNVERPDQQEILAGGPKDSPQYRHNASKPGELSFTIQILGKTVLKPGFVEIGRDGGGGGGVNGKNIVLFSDTLVRGWGPINNTICYSQTAMPQYLQDFGKDGVPNVGIPYLPEGRQGIQQPAGLVFQSAQATKEQEYTDNGRGKTRVVIWPQSMINQLPGDPTRGIGVAPVSIQSAPGAPRPTGELYNTLYTITAGEQPTVERTVPKLWHDGEVLYGTFCTYLDPFDAMFYFFAGDGSLFTENTGLKVARASLQNYRDKTKWEFWTVDRWIDTPPKPLEAKEIMGGLFNSGYVFYSPFLKTYVAVYFLGIADSTFRYRYALPDHEGCVSITGTWSEEFVLYDTNHLKEGGYNFNYAGHAYPHYDQCGETLVLSMTNSDGVTPWFFRVKFDEKHKH